MKTLDLETLVLQSGAHKEAEDGMCVMEAVAYVAGERFSDSPKCACPTLGMFLRSWNDSLDEATRQKLKPYIPRLIGTNDGNSDRRAWMCLDWLSRECTPAFLELAGLGEHAAKLRALPKIDGKKSLKLASEPLAEAQRATAAARAAAWAAAGAAAGAAAKAAAWDAAWDAAKAAAWDAARDAAWAAAWDAAWDAAKAAAWDAAWDAAKAAAWDAAWVAAWAAAWAAAKAAAGDAAWAAAKAAAGDAAWAAAWRTLAPVVEKLQASAFALLDRMLALPKVSK